MNKELEPLEALDRIKRFYPNWRLTNREGFNLIETTLKEKEQQDNVIKILKEVVGSAKMLPYIKTDENGFNIISTIEINLQRSIENKKREVLRQWVLETCFPKELKALEIIKEKNIQIKTLKSWNKNYNGKLTYQNYLDILEDCDLGDKLTEEEFDLVKEILCE